MTALDLTSNNQELVDDMAICAMLACKVPVIGSPFAHWQNLARFLLDKWADTSMFDIAKESAIALCEHQGIDPYQKSLGLGSLIPKDQPYELWEAHVTTARGLLRGFRIHVLEILPEDPHG